jgi:hypothetical protein
MAIEVIGPPAAGKTTFLRELSPAMVTVHEPLHELSTAGLLPTEPGIGRQKAVIDHVLTQLALAGEGAIVDSGIIYLLAFSHLRFSLDPALTDLFEETAAASQTADIRFSGIIRLTAPMQVLEQRMLADASRKRGHFQENVMVFGTIYRLIDELMDELGQQFLFTVDNTGDSNQMCMAREWTMNRPRHWLGPR